MTAFLSLLEGKKTYIVAALIALCSGAQALGYVVPEWLWLLLNAAGFGAVRSAIGKRGPAPFTFGNLRALGEDFADSVKQTTLRCTVPLALVLCAGLLLGGCAQLNSFGAGLEAGAVRFTATGSHALLKINTRLARQEANIGLWAGRCATALGYVHTIAALTGNISPAVVANADRAAAACKALAENPQVSAASIATGIATALTTLQTSAQLPPAPLK